MLRTDLLELINSRSVWAFIGSGISVDSGCPTWSGLVEKTLGHLDEERRQKILADSLYKKGLEKKDFAKCFSRIENYAGREHLENAVLQEIQKIKKPGEIVKRLADWPFAGYITTNYDNLLELALGERREHGWSTVGNSDNEVRKVSGDVSQVIWHIHGSVGLSNDKSKLILTEKDYDDFYLEDGPLVKQLRGFLTHHRIMFIGFGMQDPEIMRILKLVGRLCNPARTTFAVLSGLSGTEHEHERKEFLEKYNIDVIPYKTIDNSHKKLLEAIDLYGSMILKRSLRFNQPKRPCPSYDPETTGLLIYNEFCLGKGTVSNDILGALLKARVLSLLKHRSPCTIKDLIEDLDANVKKIRDIKNQYTTDTINKTLKDIIETGLAQLLDGNIVLTAKGFELVGDQAATAERLSDQFSASIKSRAIEHLPEDIGFVSRIAVIAESFLKDCIERRALGVAMTMSAPSAFHSYQMVGLLQALPEFISQLSSSDEAIALIKLIQDVLSKPSEAEAKYIGLALQARFGVHLLGHESNTLKARARDFSETLFLVDSSTLIPFLARSSVGNSSATLLIKCLKDLGSIVASTTFLTEEVAEHAYYAINKIKNEISHVGVPILEAVTGHAGNRSNMFFDGFLKEIEQGAVPDFFNYINSILECPKSTGYYPIHDFEQALEKKGIHCPSFDKWDGFNENLFHERDELQNQITEIRRNKGTYKHERQTKAEAEALIIVRMLREKIFKIEGRIFNNAYFVSYTRVIDDVAGSITAITMHPEAVLQWVTTLTPCSVEELSYLTNSLLWEMVEQGINIIDKRQLLHVFNPLIDASKEKLEEELVRHRGLIATRYGEEAAKAFGEASDLEIPIVVHSYYVQKAEELERKLKVEETLRKVAQTQAKLSEEEHRELERLRTEKKNRQKKALSKKRAAASKKKKRT